MKLGAPVVLGEVVRAVGLRGEVKLQARPDCWSAALGSPRLELELQGTRRRAPVESVRVPGPGSFVLGLHGVGDRDAAEALVGALLVLPAGDDAVAPPETLRPFQVRGLRVEDAGGAAIGVVSDLVETPAHAVLVVRGAEREHWIPMVPAIVLEVDLEAGRVRVDPPPGLLEI